jgi:uncharacterized protein YaiI (UPF0178 family)
MIWVDADSCPVPVRHMVERFALRLAIPTAYVANHPIPHPADPLFTMVVTGTEEGAADDHIASHIAAGDLAVTRDIPLAARLVEQGARVINDRGTRYTRENIGERLSERNFHLQLDKLGLYPDRTGVYRPKDLALFANCLDREIHRKG